MEQHLAEALEQTDDIIESVQHEPPPARPSATGEKSLHEKLYDIYVEECGKDPEVEGLQSNVNLLEKLLRREALPCLVVNLYPENQGYSLMLKDKDGILIEPFPVPYLGQKLLEYLDAEELPSFLIDVLEKSPVNVFHHGCVIAEIRDYRQCSDIHPPGELRAEPAVSSDVSSAASSAETSAELSAEPSAESSAVSSTMPSTTPPPAYQTRHILLRPTMQSLVSDVESITSDNRQWTEEEKLELESQLILATAEPLCLDPSVAVACTANRLLFNEQKMMTDPMRQCFTSHDWPYLQLEEGQYICTTPPDVSTMVACRKRAEPKPGDQYDLKIAEAGKCVDTWKQRPCELAAPGEVDVHKYARGKQAVPCDDAESTAWSPPEVKYDYPFECDEGSQLWEAQPSTSTAQAQPLSEPFFSPEVRPPTGGRCDSQMYLPLVAPSDHSGGSVAGEGIEPGKATGVGQGSVQRTAECLSKILQGSTDSFPLGQPSQGKKVTSHSVSSPALEKRVNTPAPLLTQPSTSGQGSSAVSSPPLRGRKLPRLATSPKSASSAQQTFWGVSGVGTLPSAAQSSASSTESSSAATQRPSSGTGQNVINLLGLAQRGPVLVSSPSQVLSFPTAAPASTETSSRGFLPPPRSQMLSAQSRAPQRSVQTSLKLIVKNTSGPVTVRLPPGSVILHPESQAQRQQPWPQPQQPKSQQQPRPQPQQSQPQLVQQAQPRQPQLLQQAQPRQAQLVQQAQSRQAQLVQQAQSRQAQLVQQAQSRQAQLVQQAQSRQAQLVQQVQSRQAQLLQQVQSRQAQLLQQAQPRQAQLKRQAQLVQQAQPRQPQLLQQAQPRQLQLLQQAQPRQAQLVQQAQPRQAQLVQQAQPRQAQLVQQVQPRQAQLLQQAQPRQAQLVQQVQPRQAQLLQQAQPRQAQLLQQAQPRQAQLLQQAQPRQAQLLQQAQPRQLQLLQQAQPRQYLRPELQRQKQSEPLYVLIPKQHQPPRAPVPSRSVPPAYPQRSSIQQWALSAQQRGLLNLAEIGSARQPQATVVYQLGSTQQSQGHTLPAQSFQYPAARVEQLQARGQNVQLRVMPRRVALPRAALQHSHQGHTGGQYRGTGRGGPPTAPEP